MIRLKGYLQLIAKTVLLSIQPVYAAKILTGEKRLEFRRNWAMEPVDLLVIYATSPSKKIVATAEIKQVISGSKTKLWNLAKEMGGGISRRKLFAYLEGKKKAFAIEMQRINAIPNGLDPINIFGQNFRPPQSFRYLTEREWTELLAHIMKK